MKNRLVVAGGLLVAGAGCSLFANPPVECDPNREAVVQLEQTVSPARAGLPCAFVDPYPFTVAYAPRVDRLALAESAPGTPASADSVLIGGAVKVTQSSAATRLCASVEDACANGGAPEIATTIRGDGSLAYQGLFSVDALGVVLNPGDSYSWTGVVATEIFGPGNSCPVKGSVTLTCQKPQ